jgi:hypothetical protein
MTLVEFLNSYSVSPVTQSKTLAPLSSIFGPPDGTTDVFLRYLRKTSKRFRPQPRGWREKKETPSANPGSKRPKSSNSTEVVAAQSQPLTDANAASTTSDQPSSNTAMFFYLRNPELAKRYFPDLYKSTFETNQP